MLSIVLILGLSAVINCAHISVKDVDALIDKTIVEIRKEKSLKFPEFPTAEITGLENLKRHGECKKTEKDTVFHCKAVSEEAKIMANGEHEEIKIHLTFEVVVDAEGKLVSYKTIRTDINFKDEPVGTFYKGWLKKTWDKIKHVAEAALHAVIETKVKSIVTTIAMSVLGG